MSNYFPRELPQYPEIPEQPASFVGGFLEAYPSTGPNPWYGTDAQSSGSLPRNPGRTRLRMPAGQDHVKHRRTRSGCYTCRERRVKVPGPNRLR